MCSRPADLVFSPTLACGDVRRRLEVNPRATDSHPLPYGAGLTSKPLHARRPMVALRGSFRPRLASTTGVVPRATTDPDGSTASSIGTPVGSPRTARWRRTIRERPAHREEVDRARAGVGERRRARGGGRPGGQHVVHQKDRLRRGSAPDRSERSGHRCEPLLTRAASLRPDGIAAADVRRGREIEPARERPGQDLRLVEPALGPPPGGEGHPRDGVGLGRAERDERARQRLAHAPPPGEFQATDRRPGRTAVRERRPRGSDRGGRAIGTRVDVAGGRTSAPAAPGWCERFELRGASRAERPCASGAAGAGTGEQDIERTTDHAATVGRPADRFREDKSRPALRPP